MPRIAIIGAGPAGLTLALLLHKHNIPSTIFELRQKLTDETLSEPAGSLDLHEGSGLTAIRECNVFDEFTSLTGDCTEELRIADKNGNIIYEDKGELSNRPEIARPKIIKLLIDHLPVESVKWGYRLVRARRIQSSPWNPDANANAKTEIELDFGENGKHTFDFVIGADGAWSRVRAALLTNVQPQYAGMHLITLDIRQITTKYPHLAEYIGQGTFNSLGHGHGVCAQRSVQDSARIYIFLSTDDENFTTTTGLKDMTHVDAGKHLLNDNSLFGDWGTRAKELISVACNDETSNKPNAKINIRPLYKLPNGHKWPHQCDATAIGDAAHLMNPPAGEGVNIAMLDALLLSQAIIKAHETAAAHDVDCGLFLDALDPFLKEFEAHMAVRAKEMAKHTAEISGMMFGGEDGASVLADWFKSFQAGTS
ncbi:hypothetical protein MPDQ_002155 [Monascus purpureus]|uniref:FAD-binding domain-containing protein n=1 Tax=Monascus purpureus TaxID=5098 RepID=A0A507QL27_MONPU|nr:hypothetical protein MPDQ_002155 [Monascus purpureus]BDD62148.1 hypothetical protein MAP00_007134 [Monascus purpureus]